MAAAQATTPVRRRRSAAPSTVRRKGSTASSPVRRRRSAGPSTVARKGSTASSTTVRRRRSAAPSTVRRGGTTAPSTVRRKRSTASARTQRATTRSAGRARAAAVAVPSRRSRSYSQPLPRRRLRPVTKQRQQAHSQAARWPFVTRLLGSRFWIWGVALALGGIVAVQVSLLKLNAGISSAVEQAGGLEQKNASLEAEIAQLSSSERVREAAEKQGMVMLPAGSVSYLKASRGDAGYAAARMQAPTESALQLTAQLFGAGAVAAVPEAIPPTSSDPSAAQPEASTTPTDGQPTGLAAASTPANSSAQASPLPQGQSTTTLTSSGTAGSSTVVGAPGGQPLSGGSAQPVLPTAQTQSGTPVPQAVRPTSQPAPSTQTTSPTRAPANKGTLDAQTGGASATLAPR